MKAFLFFILSCFCICIPSVKSQDIIRTQKDTILSKVIEIGIEEIKYKDFRNPGGPVIVIPKKDVVMITFENGSKFFVTPDPYDVNKVTEVRNKTRSIKFEFFSPPTNDIAFGYETMISVGKNLEFKMGVIGPGTRANTDKASGVFIKGGIKFLTSPTYIQNGVKYAHALKGAYIKPEIIFTSFSREKTYEYYNGGSFPYYITETRTIRNSDLCFNIVFGKQHILGNVLTLDYYFGAGYGFRFTDHAASSPYYTDYGDEYYYSHSYLGNNTPLIVTGGLTLGVLL